MNDKSYFSRVLMHYITLALSKAGARADDDMYAELRGMTEDYEETMAKLTARIDALEKKAASTDRALNEVSPDFHGY